MKYDGSHKLKQISVGGGGIGLNPCTRMAEIVPSANVEGLRVLPGTCPMCTTSSRSSASIYRIGKGCYWPKAGLRLI